MKKENILYIILILFTFIFSFLMTSFRYSAPKIISLKNIIKKDSNTLDNFINDNNINKEDIMKIDEVYYSLKDDNRIIDLNIMKFVSFNDVIKDNNSFKDLLFRELRKKYPLFIVENIINKEYVKFNVFNDKIYISYLGDEGSTYDVTLICRDYKDFVLFNCTDDIDVDPNEVSIDINKKVVALTFDDGPSIYTEGVMEQLNNFNMKATFFELGSLMERNPLLVKKVVDNGFEVGSHGYNHKAFTKLKVEGTLQDINRTNEIYKNITGEDIKLVRPPYGSINASIRDSINVTFIKWNVDSLDWKVRDERYVENIMSTVKDGDIILAHDIHKTTLEHLNELLMRLYNEGYQVVTVSELASLKGVVLETNKVYFHF